MLRTGTLGGVAADAKTLATVGGCADWGAGGGIESRLSLRVNEADVDHSAWDSCSEPRFKETGGGDGGGGGRVKGAGAAECKPVNITAMQPSESLTKYLRSFHAVHIVT